MKKASLRRKLVGVALGFIALVATGCTESYQSASTEVLISADGLRAQLLREDGPPPYTLLLVRLEAYRVAMQSDSIESMPQPANFGDPDKVAVATTEILGSVFMQQLEACAESSTCRIALPFLVPGGGPLEIRAYAFFANNYDIEGSSPAPFALATEIMFGSTLYRGARDNTEGEETSVAGRGSINCLAPTSDSADVGIRLGWWNDFMCQLPPGFSHENRPDNNFGESGQGPGYSDITGNVTITSGVDAAGRECNLPDEAPSSVPGQTTTVIAWDSQFGVPYIGTNTVYYNEIFYNSCSGGGCYSLNYGTGNLGVPGTRTVDIFGVFTGALYDSGYNALREGYAIVNGQRVEYDDSYDIDAFSVAFNIDFIGQQGLTQRVYVNTSASGQPNEADLTLNGCARSSRLAINMTEEVFSNSNTSSLGAMLPLTLPALRQAAERRNDTNEDLFGQYPLSLGNRAAAYLVDSSGGLIGSSAGGLTLTGQSRNIIDPPDGGGEIIIPQSKGSEGPDFAPLPTAWNVVPVPTFGIPYPGGAKWQQSNAFISNLYDPRDPCQVMNFDFTPCYFSFPVTTEVSDYPPSLICDPEVVASDPDESCYEVPAVVVENVPLNPNVPLNVANAKVRRFNPPTGCAVTPDNYFLVKHPYIYGSDGGFLLAGRLAGDPNLNAGVDSTCYSTYWGGNSHDDLGVARRWRGDHYDCDPWYFVGTAGGFPEAGDSFQLSATTDDGYDMGWNWASTPVNLTCTGIFEGVLVGGVGLHGNNNGNFDIAKIDPYRMSSSGSLQIYPYSVGSGPSMAPFSGIAIDPDDEVNPLAGISRPYGCTVYAGEMYASNSAGMFLIDTDDGAVYNTQYPVGGNLNLLAGDISDLTFDPVGSQVLAMLDGGLYGINLSNGNATLRGPASSNGGALAITPDGSTLYTVLAEDLDRDADGDLAIIDRTTASVISMIPLDDSVIDDYWGACMETSILAGSSFEEVSCDLLSMTVSTDGRLFALIYWFDDNFGSEATLLVIIDPVTGAMELLGEVTYDEFSNSTYINSIAWAPEECELDHWIGD